MFGKKKGTKKEGQHINVSVTSIPDVFYGGQNPNVYNSGVHAPDGVKKETKTKKASSDASITTTPTSGKSVYGGKKPTKLNKKQVKHTDARDSVHMDKGPSIVRLFMSHKLLLVGVLIFLIGVGWITLFYMRGFGEPQTQVVEVPLPAPELPVREAPAPPPPPPEPEIIEPEVEEEPEPQQVFDITFPQFSLVNTVDTDSDELTDLEEALFGTDTGIWDSDNDSYFDGQEILNLYDPDREGAAKLIDSGLVSEYVHPDLNYVLYYPSSWITAEVDEQTNHVIISAQTGEYISIRKESKVRGQDFARWFAAHARAQRFRDVETVENAFDVQVQERKDHLVAYVEEGDSVYVLSYHAPDQGPVRYRRVMQMIIASFRPPLVAQLVDQEQTLHDTSLATSTDEL